MTQYAAWLIDLDGTLYRALPVKVAMGLELLGADRRVRNVIRAFRREHEAMRLTDLPPEADAFAVQLARTAERLDCTIDFVRTIVDDWMFARPGRWLRRFQRSSLLAEITQFRANGGRTALVSDYPARTKLLALHATGLFDTVIANGETERPYRLKPSPEPFLMAATALNLPTAQCLVLGDRNNADGLAAQRAGMAFRRIPGDLIRNAIPDKQSSMSLIIS